MMGACPHANAINCPLYHAAHLNNAGCFPITSMRCNVTDRKAYEREIERLKQSHPLLYGRVVSASHARQSEQQRATNQKLLGLH